MQRVEILSHRLRLHRRDARRGERARLRRGVPVALVRSKRRLEQAEAAHRGVRRRQREHEVKRRGVRDERAARFAVPRRVRCTQVGDCRGRDVRIARHPRRRLAAGDLHLHRSARRGGWRRRRRRGGDALRDKIEQQLQRRHGECREARALATQATRAEGFKERGGVLRQPALRGVHLRAFERRFRAAGDGAAAGAAASADVAVPQKPEELRQRGELDGGGCKKKNSEQTKRTHEQTKEYVGNQKNR